MKYYIAKIISSKEFLSHLITVGLIILIVLVTFDGIKSVYFLQDEWYGFGRVQYSNLKELFVGGNHFTPISVAFFYFEYKTFGLNHIGYLYVALVLHVIAAFGVYILATKLFKSKLKGTLASLLFASAYISHHTVTWIGSSYTTIPATIFGTLSLFLFLKFLSTGAGEKLKYLYSSFFVLFLSLLCKEDAIFLFLFYPLATLIYEKKLFKYVIILSIVTGIIYFGLRTFFGGGVGSLNTIGRYEYSLYILRNLIIFPLSGLTQLFIPNNSLINLSKLSYKFFSNNLFKDLPPAYVNDFIVTTFFNWVNVAFAFVMIIFIGIYTYLNRNTKMKKIFIIFILFCLLAFTPFALVYGVEGLENRHFYFPMVGGSIITSYVFFQLWKYFKYILLKLVLIISLLVYFNNNITLIKNYTQKLAKISYPRIKAVSDIQSMYKKVPPKSIFYITADIAYFIPENPLPFQQGNGYTMMVLFGKQNSYASLFKKDCLWDLGSQGYCKDNDIGFGFFTDKKLFLKAYKENKLKPENAFAGFWYSIEMRLEDKTQQIRLELSKTKPF